MTQKLQAYGLASALLFAASAAHASGGPPPPPGGLDNPSQFQNECAREAALAGPTRAVFGFDGLNAYDDGAYRDLKSRPTPPRADEPIPDHGGGHLLWG